MLPGVENLSGIRTFRVLRALRTISAVKGKFSQQVCGNVQKLSDRDKISRSLLTLTMIFHTMRLFLVPNEVVQNPTS